jgi:hypothetical protein
MCFVSPYTPVCQCILHLQFPSLEIINELSLDMFNFRTGLVSRGHWLMAYLKI